MHLHQLRRMIATSFSKMVENVLVAKIAALFMIGQRSIVHAHQVARAKALKAKEKVRVKSDPVGSAKIKATKARVKERKESHPGLKVQQKDAENPKMVFVDRCKEPSMYRTRPELSHAVSLRQVKLTALRAKLITMVIVQRGLTVENGTSRIANGQAESLHRRKQLCFLPSR